MERKLSVEQKAQAFDNLEETLNPRSTAPGYYFDLYKFALTGAHFDIGIPSEGDFVIHLGRKAKDLREVAYKMGPAWKPHFVAGAFVEKAVAHWLAEDSALQIPKPCRE